MLFRAEAVLMGPRLHECLEARFDKLPSNVLAQPCWEEFYKNGISLRADGYRDNARIQKSSPDP